MEHIKFDSLKAELPAYLTAAANFTVDHHDVHEFTDKVLKFWASHSTKFPEWSRAARIVFAFTPNSAACERVFSLLKIFIGDQQASSLGDQIQTALMLAYNKRRVG